jgi:hypothetical protein
MSQLHLHFSWIQSLKTATTGISFSKLPDNHPNENDSDERFKRLVQPMSHARQQH